MRYTTDLKYPWRKVFAGKCREMAEVKKVKSDNKSDNRWGRGRWYEDRGEKGIQTGGGCRFKTNQGQGGTVSGLV